MTRNDFKVELRPMLSLALPVVLGELGWMAMGVVDTMMVGRVSAEALGAVGIGRALFMAVNVLGLGLLLALDTFVSQAFGAGRHDDCRRWLVTGLWVAGVLSIPFTLVLLLSVGALPFMGLDAEVEALAPAYLWTVAWATLPLTLVTATRRYLQAINLVRPVMLALVSANVVNALGNWILIFGNLGAPELGIAGAGWATVLSSTYLLGFLGVAVLLHHRERGYVRGDVSWGLDLSRVWRLARLGTPIMLQVGLELGVFSVATILAGRLAPAALAAHQIALTLASITFMVPLGCSAAGAVRVGQALGRGDPAGARRSGWTAIVLGGLFMTAASIVFLAIPHPLFRLFTFEADVIAFGVTLLAVAAVFQSCDGIQVVTTGVLRGTGDTKTPMLLNLGGHWFVGLPLGAWLCFRKGFGVVGLWIGLAAGLVLIGVVLIVVWTRRSRHFAETVPED